MIVLIVEECNTNYYIIFWTTTACLGNNKRMAIIMNTTGCCKRSIKLFFSVEDNSQSNSNIYKLYIFISFFFSPFFSWLLVLISFNFHLHVILLPSYFSFFLCFFEAYLFFTLSGCAYH